MSSAPVTVDDFLALEEEARRLARLRAPAREVRRFHAAVRRFAAAWCVSPHRRMTASATSRGVFLNLEVNDRHGWVPVFSLRALHPKGEFCLVGPDPDRKKVRLSAGLRKGLEDLLKAWRQIPGAEESGGSAVIVHLPTIADSGFDRFLQTALEILGTE